MNLVYSRDYKIVAAKAINEAKISVAEQEKIGEAGKALADNRKRYTNSRAYKRCENCNYPKRQRN